MGAQDGALKPTPAQRGGAGVMGTSSYFLLRRAALRAPFFAALRAPFLAALRAVFLAAFLAAFLATFFAAFLAGFFAAGLAGAAGAGLAGIAGSGVVLHGNVVSLLIGLLLRMDR